MNTRKLSLVRKTLSLVGILAILSTLLVSIPLASAYSGADADKAGVGWAKAAVDAACEKELIDCTLADPGFKTVVNRAVGYQMLTKGFGVFNENARSPFADSKSQWFGNAASTAYTLGWTAGEGGKFNGGGELTRAMMSVAASSVLGLKDCDAAGLDAYTDKAQIPSWAKGPMACMVGAKLMGQGGVKTLNPNKGAIKAEVITILNAQVDYAEEEGIDVMEVAAERLGVDVETLQEALDTGANVVDGELVVVEEGEEEEEAEEEEEEEAEEEEEEEEEETPPPPPPAGALAVALGSDSPAARTINPGASGAPLATFTFSVSEGSASLATLVFKRTGGGASTDFSAVSLYQGSKRLKAGKTISADTNQVDFTGLGLTVAAAAPVTLTLKGDVTTTAGASSTHQFGLEAAASVTTSAGSVTGVPVTSNTMTIGGATVGTVTVATVNTLSKPSLGAKQVEVANFKLTSGSNDIKFNAITLTHGGTVSRTNLANLKLTDSIDQNTALASATALDGDLLVFTLAAPYTVAKNNNRSFRVWGDVTGGKTSDTLDFYLDEVTDLDAVDATVGFGARVTNNLTKALVTDTTFQGGKITLTDNGPAAQNVSTNTTNVHLFDLALTADRNVTVRDYFLWLEQTAFDATSAVQLGTTTDYVAAGSSTISTALAAAFSVDDAGSISRLGQYDVLKVTSDSVDYYIEISATPTTAALTGTLIYPRSLAAAVQFYNNDDVTKVFDKHLRTRVKNLKLIDVDTGGTLASVTNSSYINVFSDDFDLIGGQTRNLAVLADLDSTLTANNAFRGGVDIAESSQIKDPEANEFIATSDVVGGNSFGKAMTAVTASLTVSRASTPVSETHVKGQAAVNLLGLSVKAGDGGNVRVSKVIARLVADDDTTFDNSGYGDTAANTIVNTVTLVKVNADNTETKIAGPVGLSLVGTIGAAAGYYKAEFPSLAYTVTKSTTEKWLLKADLKNTITATRYLGADLILNGTTANDIEAQDKDGNTVTPAQAAGASATGPNNLATGNPTVLKTIATAGSLTGAQEGSPSAGVVVAGTTNQSFSKYKFTATNEAFTVTKLDVVGTTTSATAFTGDESTFTGGNNISLVKLQYALKDGTTETKSANLSSGKASFTNLNFYVPKNGSASITLLSDLNTVEFGAVSGTSFRLGLNERNTVATNAFEAIGEGSNEKLTSTSVSTLTNASSVNPMVLRKTVPTVATVAGLSTKLTNGLNSIAAITVAADAKAAVGLRRVAFEFSSVTVTVNALELYKKIGAGTESAITTDVSLRNRAGVNLKSGGTNLATDGASTTDTVYVTWDKTGSGEETVSAGATNTYLVRANIAGAATSGESVSTNIGDDSTRLGSTFDSSNTAVGGIDELRTLTGVASGSVESSDASVANTRTVWRWLFNDSTSCPFAAFSVGCIFLDRGGDGAYTSTADPLFNVSNSNTITSTSSLTSGAIIPGALYTTTTDVDGGASNAGAGIYWDLATTFGSYTAASDIAIGLSAGLAATNNGLVALDFRFRGANASVGVYIDSFAGDSNAFTLADNTLVGTSASSSTGLTLVTTFTQPTADNEAYTQNANFIWSDTSVTGHSATSTDWTNGVDIPNLPTTTLSLSF